MENTYSIPAFSILSLGPKSPAESPRPIMRCCPRKECCVRFGPRIVSIRGTYSNYRRYNQIYPFLSNCRKNTQKSHGFCVFWFIGMDTLKLMSMKCLLGHICSELSQTHTQILLPLNYLSRIVVASHCPIRFNGLPVSDERCGQFGCLYYRKVDRK